jgi:hypothetical protein
MDEERVQAVKGEVNKKVFAEVMAATTKGEPLGGHPKVN